MADDAIVESGDPDPDGDAAIEAAVAEITQSPGEQQADRVKNALIQAKRDLRDAKRENNRLTPIAARATEIDGKLTAAQPIIDAVLSNPTLRAEALRIAGGGAPSRSTTEQPTNDADAIGYAEDSGYYLADGVTPDAARARRVLDRQAKAIRQVAEEVVRPYAGVTLGDRAERNIQQAIKQTDDDGTPIATEASIREVVGRLPANLLADPQVVEIMLDNAAGMDRRKGRTPKKQDEPLFMESPGGRGARREPAISSDMKQALARVGLTEKEFTDSSKRADEAFSNRRGVVLGGK